LEDNKTIIKIKL